MKTPFNKKNFRPERKGRKKIVYDKRRQVYIVPAETIRNRRRVPKRKVPRGIKEKKTRLDPSGWDTANDAEIFFSYASSNL